RRPSSRALHAQSSPWCRRCIGVGRPDHHADVSTIREIDGYLLDCSGMQPTFMTGISRGRLAMPIPATRVPPALKHGAYSKAALLPGEDPAAFDDLHRDLIAEFTPHGRMEDRDRCNSRTADPVQAESCED